MLIDVLAYISPEQSLQPSRVSIQDRIRVLVHPGSFFGPAHTSVGHAHDDGVHAQVGAAVDERLHARDERLAALQPKALSGRKLVGQEGLEHLAPGQAVQDVQLAVRRVGELQMSSSEREERACQGLAALQLSRSIRTKAEALSH